MTPRTSLQALLILIALALPTVFFGIQQSGLRVDAENRSLKSIGTPEARAIDRLVRGFGHDHVALLAFSTMPVDRTEFTRGEVRQLEAVRAAVAELPGIRSVDAIAEPSYQVLMVRADGDHYANAVRAAIEVARRDCPVTASLHVTGQPVGETVIADAASSEQAKVIPIIAVALFALLLLCYRSVALALTILLPAGAGIAWTGGVFALFGHGLDPIAVLLQPVILTVGVAGSVHLVEAFLMHRLRGEEAPSAVRLAIRDILFPALLTVGTTVFGFLALTVNAIPAVADFGFYAAFGVSVTCGLAFWMVPSLLVLGGRRPLPQRLRQRHESNAALGLALTAWVRSRSRVLIAGALAIAALSAWQWQRLEVDNDPLRVLPAAHAFRQDTQEVAERLGGVETFGLLVPGDSAAADPERFTLLVADVLSRDGVVGPTGPPLRAASGDLLFEALLAPGGSGTREALFDAIDDHARVLGFEDVGVAGTSVQVARDSGRLVRGQLAGLALTLACLFATIAIAFRSVLLGFLGMLPNLLPCLVIYGLLAAAGRPLSVATAMIGSVMLGLVVDDTIHFLYRFRVARAGGTSVTRSLARAIVHAGRPVVITSLVLSVGFAAGLAGNLETTREFSALAAATILGALAADLVLLPALLFALARPRPHQRPRRRRTALHGVLQPCPSLTST